MASLAVAGYRVGLARRQGMSPAGSANHHSSAVTGILVSLSMVAAEIRQGVWESVEAETPVVEGVAGEYDAAVVLTPAAEIPVAETPVVEGAVGEYDAAAALTLVAETLVVQGVVVEYGAAVARTLVVNAAVEVSAGWAERSSKR